MFPDFLVAYYAAACTVAEGHVGEVELSTTIEDDEGVSTLTMIVRHLAVCIAPDSAEVE